MRFRTVDLLLAAAAGLAPLAAQQRPQVTVPAANTNVEGDGLVFWALSPFDARRQLLLDARHLGQIVNQPILTLSVRRNAAGDRHRGGRLHVEVWMSHTSRAASAPQAAFAGNRGADHQQVFAGWLTLPDVPQPTTAPAPWVAPFAVDIPLDTPFAYLGGTLCIETITTTDPTAPTPWWPIDAVVQPERGAATSYGTSCMTNMGTEPATADTALLALGSTATLSLSGPRPTPAPVLCMIGTNRTALGPLRLPYEMGPLGAPGCWLLTSGQISIPTALQPLGPRNGLATVRAPIPATPALANIPLFVQWALSDATENALGWSTSNAIHLQLGASLPRWDIGWVESTDLGATTGSSYSGRIPVLCLQT